MRYGVLGPLRVSGTVGEVPITAGRDRIVLAMLLLRAGRIVGRDELIDAVWGAGAPATARGQLQTCVSRLRRVLPEGAIRTDPAGYAIEAGVDELDLTEFLRLVARARSGGAEQGAKLLREALQLWRGPALAGLDAPAVRQQAAVLDEQHATAAEEWVELELAAGHEREIVAELTGLAERYPLRERLRGQLMLALHRLGRQADALAEFRRARQLLRDELGIEPGRPLQELHRLILTGEAAAAAREWAPAGPVRTLPRTVGDFTGRAEVLARLVRGAGHRSVLTIDGMAGSGKTTLALRVAELVGDAYPEVQLFLDLHGHSDHAPVEPAAALLLLLGQLGVPPGRIPPDEDGRAALWRSELAGRRALIVLDNAASSDQVIRLLPGSPTSLCLVTSRRRLTGLDDAHPEVLEVLDEPEAVALLGRIVGERVAMEPAAALELVRLCGCLPLAIRLAGSRLAHRRRWAVADLVRRLGDSLLPELAAETRTVAGAFGLSFQQLPAAGQRVFRLLGLHPAHGFRAVSVAALAGLPLRTAEDLLDDLVDVHLIEEVEPGRYRLHDLIRHYAATLAEALPSEERDSALTALVDLHLYASAELSRAQDPMAARDFPRGAPARPDLVAAAVAEPRWRPEQQPALTTLIQTAAALGEAEQAWRLARVNWHFLFYGGHLDETIATQSAALAAARAAGDGPGVSSASNYLASGLVRAGRFTEALQLIRAVVDYEQENGSPEMAARARGNMGEVLSRLGRTADALREIEVAYRAEQRFAPNWVVAMRNLARGSYLRTLGRYEESIRSTRLTLQAAVEQRLESLAASALAQIAEARIGLGQLEVAERLLRSALPLLRAHQVTGGECDTYYILGLLDQRRGRYESAVEWFLKGLGVAQRAGMWPMIASGSNGLGAVLHAMGDVTGAAELHTRALTIARQTEFAPEEARALRGLGDCVSAEDPGAARRYWRRALEIFERMGSPEHAELAARLAALDG
ncbi:AfsR/SARP family transcriptional regulator [Actinoplanes sp. RD1]|uniref:AfsR/SARP family transcriptional regulator n=1 Tax=Actinoplanes sp. RD1 TaxID=3064538 RepID=UPI0027410E6E|nr:BTAD domain-containing putative transcriptional regulator [Actinoplanes sp. RD1]